MASHDTEPGTDGEDMSTLAWLIDSHVILVAIAIYVVASIPVYFWMVGTIGDAGTIEGGVVIAALVTGSLLFVPTIMGWLRKKKFQLGYGRSTGETGGIE